MKYSTLTCNSRYHGSASSHKLWHNGHALLQTTIHKIKEIALQEAYSNILWLLRIKTMYEIKKKKLVWSINLTFNLFK